MTDLRELLDTAAGEPAAPTPDVVSSDLRRGRLALRRRRGVRGASVLVAASAAVALGLVVVPGLGGDGTTRQTVIAAEQGRYSPSLEIAFQIARVFEVPLDDVFQYPEVEETKR